MAFTNNLNSGKYTKKVRKLFTESDRDFIILK